MCRESWNWFIAILISLQQVHGHGRMEEPPARNAAWRYGFDVPVNYDDVGLNCGGLGVQKINGGKCGVCGDSYTGPRYHETGGKYATNTIVQNYVSGALIDIKILLSANHNGFMEFRLCPALNSNTEVTQECLNENILHIEGFGVRYPVNQGMDLIFLRAQLPRGLSCARCVLQWRYHAGNNWGRNIATGDACLGCGPQEEFYNCADISITRKDHSLLLTRPTTTEQNPLLLFPFSNPVVFSPTVAPAPIIISPPTTTELVRTVPSNFIFPFRPSEELIDQLDDNKNKILRCYPSNEALKPLVGIENWCQQLCAINCSPTLCVCV